MTDNNHDDRGPLKADGKPLDTGQHLRAMNEYLNPDDAAQVAPRIARLDDHRDNRDQSLSGTFFSSSSAGQPLKEINPPGNAYGPGETTIPVEMKAAYKDGFVKITFSQEVKELVIPAAKAFLWAEVVTQNAMLAQAQAAVIAKDRSKRRGQ